MSVLQKEELMEQKSRMNEQYYCLVEKAELMPGVIRVYFDARGDNSQGPILDPLGSCLGSFNKDFVMEYKKAIDGKFTADDSNSQITGYLDFVLDKDYLVERNIIGFRYGSDGFSRSQLFRFDENFIKKYNPQAK